MTDIYHCAMCGIHLFTTKPGELARHAAHNEAFAIEIQTRINQETR